MGIMQKRTLRRCRICFREGSSDTPLGAGFFRTGHGGGSEVAGSRHFECSPSVVFSAGGEQGDFV